MIKDAFATHRFTSLLLLSLLSLAMHTLSGADVASADEGMWLFNHPPKKLLKQQYQFEATDKWLEHLQRSAVRFNSGGSGSFVSPNGLVMTNHHVGADTLQKVSTPEKDFINLGFQAKTQAEEIKSPDLELNVLMSIEDVTARVEAAVKADMPLADAQKARRAVTSAIEKESLDKTGLRSDVVTLYQGGQYHLYRYKKYTDVRLVFAPEQDVAFFGGDPDNFEYPRYDLDICFFRVYENDKPAKIEHYLTWSGAGCKDGDLVFVAGHPGHTDRLNTVAHLDYLRDVSVPNSLNILRRHEVTLKGYAERSIENTRRARDDFFGVQNSRKARLGGLAGLQDPTVMKKKKQEEVELRQKIGADTKLKQYASAFDEVSTAIAETKKIRVQQILWESQVAFNSELYSKAVTLLRMAEEDAKPNGERLREYRESNRESLEQSLFSDAPIFDDLETVKLADALSLMLEMAGWNDELARKVMAGKSPNERAAELIAGTKLKDVDLRKQLAKGGKKAVDASKDSMIELARLVDPTARATRKNYEEKVDEPMKQAYGKISKARFAISGADSYPDATFTLRLAFGTVKGYTEAGKSIAPLTDIGGAYKHAESHHNVEPFKLPETWLKAKSKLKLDTPLNFVSTADIIGGNSGSPVVNRQGELVGIIFDGNIQSLVLDYVFTEEQSRAVSVHSAGIIESLRNVYGANHLADELVGKK